MERPYWSIYWSTSLHLTSLELPRFRCSDVQYTRSEFTDRENTAEESKLLKDTWLSLENGFQLMKVFTGWKMKLKKTGMKACRSISAPDVGGIQWNKREVGFVLSSPSLSFLPCVPHLCLPAPLLVYLKPLPLPSCAWLSSVTSSSALLPVWWTFLDYWPDSRSSTGSDLFAWLVCLLVQPSLVQTQVSRLC